MKREGHTRTLTATAFWMIILSLSTGCLGENANGKTDPGASNPGAEVRVKDQACAAVSCDELADPGCAERNQTTCACGTDFVGRYVDGHCQPLVPLETRKDPGSMEEYGATVGMNGEVAVVGAPYGLNDRGEHSGAVYVFELSMSGIWTQVARLTPSDGRQGDRFGAALAADGDLILVGAPLHAAPPVQRAGAAYLFRRTAEGWQEEQQLTAFDGPKDEQFGSAVALSPLALAVGAPLDDTPAGKDAGSVYVFERRGHSLGNSTKLLALQGRAYDNFGGALAGDSLRILVGAPGDDLAGDNAGAAYLYTRTENGLWDPTRISPALPAANGLFGSALAMRGDTLLIGASGETAGSAGRAGAAYIVERGTGRWDQITRLVAPDPRAGAGFGASVAVADGLALIGACADQGPEKGCVGSGVAIASRASTGWQPRGRLTSPQGKGIGKAISLSGQSALIALSEDATPGYGDSTLFVGSIE